MSKTSTQWLPEETTAGHLIHLFCVARTESARVAAALDCFLPIAAGLAGISSKEASTLYFKTTAIGPPPGMDGGSLLRDVVAWYARRTGLDPQSIIMSLTFSNQNYRAFSQRLAEGQAKHRIDIWLPAASVFAHFALLFSHLIPILEPNEVRPDEVHERVEHYNQLLQMLAAASLGNGTLVLEGHVVQPGLLRLLPIAHSLFTASLTFTVFHEMAHIELGHHNDNPRSAAQKRDSELEADRRALTMMQALPMPNKFHPLFGASITLLASSLLSSGPDDQDTATHPAPTTRLDNLINTQDKLGNVAAGSRDALAPYLRNVLANLHDRDRCPAWFGETRNAVLGLPPDYRFQYRNVDFKSQGKMVQVDHTRQPAKSRKLTVSPDLGEKSALDEK